MRDRHGMVIAPMTWRFLPLALLLVGGPLLALYLMSPKRPSTPRLAGSWSGTVHITQYSDGLYGSNQAIDDRGTIRFELETYDAFADRFRGEGTITLSDGRARAIRIVRLDQDAPGSPRVSGMIIGDLAKQAEPVVVASAPRDIRGVASATQMTFTVNRDGGLPGYMFDVIVHR